MCLVTDPASQSYLQYSVPLLKVRQVALLTQGALSSIHCRAARKKRQVREGTIRKALHLQHFEYEYWQYFKCDKLITYVSGIVIKANESIQHRFKNVSPP